jgi:hypothetical protein
MDRLHGANIFHFIDDDTFSEVKRIFIILALALPSLQIV